MTYVASPALPSQIFLAFKDNMGLENRLLHRQCRHPRWFGWLFPCLLKSVFWVIFSPSARTCTLRDLSWHKDSLPERSRAWVSNVRWKLTSSGNAERWTLFMHDKIPGTIPGGERRDTRDNNLSKISVNLLRVKLQSKVMIWKRNRFLWTHYLELAWDTFISIEQVEARLFFDARAYLIEARK